jgi:hypothetical protein
MVTFICYFTILTLRPAKVLSRKNHTGGGVPAQTERGCVAETSRSTNEHRDAGCFYRACQFHAQRHSVIGGTGLRPVVSGVTPETVCNNDYFFQRPPTCMLRLPAKFGGTPNLTGATPVPPKNTPVAAA